MINVGEITLRIGAQVEGVQQTIAQIRQLEEALGSMGGAAENETAKLGNMADKLELATQKVEQAAAQVGKAEEALSNTGLNSEQLASEVTRITSEIESAGASLEGYRREIGLTRDQLEDFQRLSSVGFADEFLADRLNIPVEQIEELTRLYELAQDGSKALSDQDRLLLQVWEQLQSTTEDLVNEEGKLLALRERVENSAGNIVQKLNEESQAQQEAVRQKEQAGQAAESLSDILQNKLNLSFTQFGQILRVLMSGRFSLSTFTALIGRAAVGLAPLLAAVSPVIVAFGVFRSRIGQLGSQISATRPEIVGMANDIADLGSINLSGLLTQLETASNRLESFGFIDADQAAGAIGEITQRIQALNATPGDASQVFQQVQQSIESANLGGLRDFDLEINTAEAQRQIDEVREKYGLAAAQAETMGIVAQAAMDRAAEGSIRAGEEAASYQGVIANLQGAWDEAVAGNEEFADTMQEIGDTANSLISTMQPVLEFIVQQLNNIAQFADRALGAIRFLFNSIINWGADVLGFFVRLIELINKLPIVEIDVSGLDEFTQGLSQSSDGAARLQTVIAQLKDGLADGMDTATAFATSLGSVLEVGTIDVRGIEQLQRTLDVSNSTVRDSIGLYLREAEAYNLTNRQVSDLTDALATYESRAASVNTENIRVERTLEDFRQAAQQTASEISGANGVVNALSSIGEASIALNQDASPANALAYFNAYLNGLEVMLDGGMEKIAMFREFVEVQLKPRLDTDEYEALISAVEATEAAAEQLAPDVDRFAGASVTAADKANTAAGAIGGIGTQALDATGLVNNLSDSMVAIPNVERTVTVTVNQVQGSVVSGIPSSGTVVSQGGGGSFIGNLFNRFTRGTDKEEDFSGKEEFTRTTSAPTTPTVPTSGPGGTGPAPTNVPTGPGGMGQAPTTPTVPDVPTGDANAGFTGGVGALAQAPRTNEEVIAAAVAAKDAAAAAEQAASLAQTPDEFNDPFENLANLLGRGGGGGGGGGGGAAEALLDVEAIREFMQEVNRAISIASREGVRIGTAGNAIPFEEGSFLNAEGGGLSVDTILIRGVWDFADPAAKRQIVNELQEALEALQAEV